MSTLVDNDHQDYEYGILHDRVRDEPHRVGMTEIEAERWIRDWLDDGGKGGVFKIIRRPVGLWELI